MEIGDENIIDDLPSSKNVSKVQKFPSHIGFFPKSFQSFSKPLQFTKYSINDSNDSNGAFDNIEKLNFNPKASTLAYINKENLNSVHKSLIEENNNSITNLNYQKDFDKNIENSIIPAKVRKKTIFAGEVSQITIPINKKLDQNMMIFEKGKEFLEKFLNFSMAFVTLLTIYCLFGDDFRTAFVPKESDIIFNIISIVCLIVFSLEIIISIIVKPAYYLSFFFFLDIISTFSIFLDLVWIQNLIFMGGQTSNIARASRFSKFGARAGRLIRLVRLFRIIKLYKTVFERQREKEVQEMIEIRNNSIFVQDMSFNLKTSGSIKNKKKKTSEKRKEIFTSEKHKKSIFSPKNKSDKWYLSPSLKQIYKRKTLEHGSVTASALSRSPEFSNGALMGEAENENNETTMQGEGEEESRVGKKLTDLTIKRVLILVFFMIFLVPLFSSNYWFDPTLSFNFGLDVIQNYTETFRNTSNFSINSDENLMSLCSSYILFNTIGDKVNYPLILLKTPINNTNCSYSNEELINKIRDDEKDIFSIGEYEATIDKRLFVINNSIISICRTLFICFILGISALLFSKDAQELVLRPLERILNKVNNISKNPLASKYEKLQEKPSKNGQDLETTFLENAIVKISTLLALGLGDAGAEIITSNIAKMGDLVCITPGVKRLGIFGFCDIRNFTDTTEALQEEVMIFVNTIAEIVHTMVDRFQGSPNKNIGDSFLLVWKFRLDDDSFINERLKRLNNNLKDSSNSKDVAEDSPFAEIINKDADYITDLSDLALMSFLKIICKINRKEKILRYRENQTLHNFFNVYKVKMGFGLHLGWAIEGSIGSDYKIDASYLSPNVNIAARLEAATKQYGVPLIISNSVYEFLSNKMKEICRKIDLVTVKGSKKPLFLYTVDIDVKNLPIKMESSKTLKEIREIHALKKMGVAFGLDNKTFQFEELFKHDKDISLAYKPLNEDFRVNFQNAIENYLNGHWQEAGDLFINAISLKENDGPCKTLLNFMSGFGFKSPLNWKGYRELIDK